MKRFHTQGWDLRFDLCLATCMERMCINVLFIVVVAFDVILQEGWS